jgi:virulence-associated protein VagC
MEAKQIVKAVKLPEGRKQLQVTVPQDIVDGIRARGIDSVVIYRRGDVVIIEPMEPCEVSE